MDHSCLPPCCSASRARSNLPFRGCGIDDRGRSRDSALPAPTFVTARRAAARQELSAAEARPVRSRPRWAGARRSSPGVGSARAAARASARTGWVALSSLPPSGSRPRHCSPPPVPPPPGYTAKPDPSRPGSPIRPRAKFERSWLRAGPGRPGVLSVLSVTRWPHNRTRLVEATPSFLTRRANHTTSFSRALRARKLVDRVDSGLLVPSGPGRHLLVACSCAITMATPTTVLAAVGWAALELDGIDRPAPPQGAKAVGQLDLPPGIRRGVRNQMR
jgi:hypothetical protein